MALTVIVNISDDAQVALEHDLLDIDAWVQAAVAGKINNCKKHMVDEAVTVLKADPTVAVMPGIDHGLIAELVKRSDYKNRAAREA